VPLDEFVHLIRDAVRGGVSVCLVMDCHEPGFYFREDVAFVPRFDIPREFIDDSARQMRFSNESTTDDHVVHIVGYQERDGVYWYLVKDSGNLPRNGHLGGYMFYREDYIQLKGLAVVLPRNVVEHSLGRRLGHNPQKNSRVSHQEQNRAVHCWIALPVSVYRFEAGAYGRTANRFGSAALPTITRSARRARPQPVPLPGG